MIEFDYNIINSSKSYRSWVKLFRKLFRLFFTIETEGEENIPDGGYILCSNHFTHIDFLLLSFSQKMPDIYCMAMSELYRKPIQGRFMLAMNCFPVERGRGRAEPAVRYAVKLLKSGRCTAIFPEGALSREYPFAPQQPKSGIARIALEADAAVLPMAIYCNGKILPGKRVRLVFGEPVSPADIRREFSTHGDYRKTAEYIFSNTKQLWVNSANA